MRGRIVRVDAKEVLVELGHAAQVAAPTRRHVRALVSSLICRSVLNRCSWRLRRPAAGPNTLRGMVESRTFLGNLVYYFVRLSADTLVIAEKSAGATSWEVNDPVGVTCPPEHVICFPADAGVQ